MLCRLRSAVNVFSTSRAPVLRGASSPWARTFAAQHGPSVGVSSGDGMPDGTRTFAARPELADDDGHASSAPEHITIYSSNPLLGATGVHNGAANVVEEAEMITLRMRIGDTITPIKAVVGQTLLDAAHLNAVNVDGTCDGDLACSTCHCVIGDPAVYEAAETSRPVEKRELEDDLLTSAFDVQPTSRLACQVMVTPEMDGMEVRYPGMVDEGRLTLEPLGRAEAKDMLAGAPIEKKEFVNMTKSKIRKIFEKHAANNPWLSDNLEEFLTLAAVLPFRTNNYVVEELIDWNNVPEDPIFQLTFPQPGMLPAEWLEEVHSVRMSGASAMKVRQAADRVRARMNPHPAKQKEMNVPNERNETTEETEFERGMQHKYRETVLFFPSEAQYCHSYCTYCFRWAQFVGSSDMQFASNAAEELTNYLRQNKSVSDLLLTGGDPMVLNSKQLGKYLDTIASDPELDHIQTIRIGSKSLAYWPYKYVTDDDADDMLALLRRVVSSGKHVSLMAHFSHPAELNTPVVQEAIRRLRATGIQIRCQAPLINHINNDPDVWADMWRQQVKMGMIPYYMFVERDTGARHWFAVPLYKALDVYNKATQKLSGLARTARGPSMSCIPGKVHVLGVETINDEKVFVLKFLQARNPAWQGRVFFAQYDEEAIWMNDLKPAFGAEKFFFEDELDDMEEASLVGSGSSGQIFQEERLLKELQLDAEAKAFA